MREEEKEEKSHQRQEFRPFISHTGQPSQPARNDARSDWLHKTVQSSPRCQDDNGPLEDGYGHHVNEVTPREDVGTLGLDGTAKWVRSCIEKEVAGMPPCLKITIVETQISRLGRLSDAWEVATVAYTTPV